MLQAAPPSPVIEEEEKEVVEVTTINIHPLLTKS